MDGLVRFGRFDRGRGFRFGFHDGSGLGLGGGIAAALDLEFDQRAADRRHHAGLAMQGGDHARDGRGQFDGGLVGHDVGQQLILGDDVADLDVPADQLRLGGAFAHVGQFEDVAAHQRDPPVMTDFSAVATRSGPGKYSHSKACG